MCMLPDNRLKIRIFTYSPSADSIIQQDPSFIRLSILHKIYGKHWPRSKSGLITVLEVELKQTGANSMPLFSLFLVNKTFRLLFDI